MKKTMPRTAVIRSIANPRRTTLAHVQDIGELSTTAAAETADPTEQAAPRILPQQTANPRRTVLGKLPTD